MLYFFTISGVVSGEICYAKICLEDGKTRWIPADPGCTTNLQLPGMNVNNPVTPATEYAQKIENRNVEVTSEKMGEEIYREYNEKNGSIVL